MRKLIFLALSLCASSAWAQSVSVGEAIEPLVAGLTVRVIREGPTNVDGQDVCSQVSPPKPLPWECGGSPPFPNTGGFTIGMDAAGNAYQVSDGYQYDTWAGQAWHYLRRVSPAGVTENLARVIRNMCVREDCSANKLFAPRGLVIDVTGGRIWMTLVASYCDPNHIPCTSTLGVVEISGLPNIQDVIAQGPAGPAGPVGPPGAAADMTLVYALQQQVATQQAEIDTLTATLARILALPGIGQRLGNQKPPQRQANP